MNIRSSYLAILSCFVIVATVIACKPADSLLHKSPANEEWQDITDLGLPKLERDNLPSLNQRVQLDAIQVEQDTGNRGSVTIDKAKLATANQNTCPKLVEFPIGATKIIRENEVMQGNYCDYYLYPKKGQRISIDNYPNYIAADLISPEYYDFANGSYLVDQADEYLIRLRYESVEPMNDPIDYEVTIQVQ